MNLFGMMDLSGSALQAERVRADVVASNMANAETTRTPDGGPYKRHHVVFSAVDDGSSFGSQLMGQGMTPLQIALPLAGISGSGGSASGTVAGGVAVTGVIEDQGAPSMRFDPTHPDADADGYVAYPDINPVTEMTDLMGAQRNYGLNAAAVQAEKGMLTTSLDILK